MRPIDWPEILQWYNSIHPTAHLKTVRAMFAHGHQKYKTWEELAVKLDVSYESIRKKKKEWKLRKKK